jgi:hypothetical protein
LLSERSLRRRACATSTGSKSRLWLFGLDWNQADAKSAILTVGGTVLGGLLLVLSIGIAIIFAKHVDLM